MYQDLKKKSSPLLLLALTLTISSFMYAEEQAAHLWRQGSQYGPATAPADLNTPMAIQIAETVLLYQRANGGWPKNYDRFAVLSESDKAALVKAKRNKDTTIDNGATHSEIRYLARMVNATGDVRYKEACLNGIAFLLEAQYDNGGWPQFYPIKKGYAEHITFNDGAMIGVMTTLRDVVRHKDTYPFVDAALRTQAARAIEKGIQCILRCQIVVDGKKTAWCAQHDERTYAPRKARSYELASLSGYESVGIVRFLMAIEPPSPEIIEAVQSAVTWFDAVKLEGIRQVVQKDPALENGRDKVIVQDSDAPALWARFYEIGTNKPIFCSRDGIPRHTLAEISWERRNGYSWLGPYATSLLNKEYPAWQQKWASDTDQ